MRCPRCNYANSRGAWQCVQCGVDMSDLARPQPECETCDHVFTEEELEEGEYRKDVVTLGDGSIDDVFYICLVCNEAARDRIDRSREIFG